VADVQRTRTIAATPETIWNVLADFGSIGSWVDKVDHSCILVASPEPVGTTRRVQLGRDTLIERIIEFDPPRALAYEIQGLPKRLRRVINRWTLRAAGGSSVVTVTSTVEIGSRPSQQLTERVMSRVVARQSDGMLAGLANRLENARV
jgi:uncharacterized protein YndB with AHSA1/START domain